MTFIHSTHILTIDTLGSQASYIMKEVSHAYINFVIRPEFLILCWKQIYKTIFSLHLPLLKAHKLIYTLYHFFIAGSANSLEYFALNTPIFLPPADDGSSDVISISGGFPFGSQTFSSMFVRWWTICYKLCHSI